MQAYEWFAGEAPALGTAENRAVSYGSTTVLSHYKTRNDIINELIAGFLQRCGVDAIYGTRAGADDPFLWIWDVPFLFITSAYNKVIFSFYGPYSTSALMSGSSTTTNSAHNFTFYSGTAASTLTYDFGLCFTGNPNNCFCLRPIKTALTAPGLNSCIKFMRGKNPLNGRTSVLWAPYTQRSGVRVIDLFSNDTLDANSLSTAGVTYNSVLNTGNQDRANNPGKFPLLPMYIAGREIPGLYHYPNNWGLPTAALNSTIEQLELELNGRTFIVTDRDTYADGNIALGLIEV